MSETDPARRTIFQGLKIDLALERVKLRDGRTVDREVVVHRGAVALVPLVDDCHVCLVRNRRYAVGKTLLEVPAGTIDSGELPEQTAARELLEETGFRAGRIRHVRDWYVSPGVMTERMYLFLCEDLEPGPAESLGPHGRILRKGVWVAAALARGARAGPPTLLERALGGQEQAGRALS